MSDPDPREYAVLGAYSLALFGVNVLFIFISAYGIFKLKTVGKYADKAELYDDVPLIKMPQNKKLWYQTRHTHMKTTTDKQRPTYKMEGRGRDAPPTALSPIQQDDGVSSPFPGDEAVVKMSDGPSAMPPSVVRPHRALPHLPQMAQAPGSRHHRSISLFMQRAVPSVDEGEEGVPIE
jgi:hypothetical protein